MRLIHLNEFDITRESILFMNGGGLIPFSKHNKLVRYFNQFDYNAIAVELPGHGKSRFHEALLENEYIFHFKENFSKLIKDKKIEARVLIGFSLGGLLALKTIEMHLFEVKYVIGFGCGFEIGENEKDMFNYYTSAKFFKDMNWEPIMKKNHKEGWKNLQISIENLMNVKSPIFTDVGTLGSDSKILIILGDNEELFTPNSAENIILENQSESIHLRIVPDTSHFEYTSKSWEKFKDVLNEFNKLNKWFI